MHRAQIAQVDHIDFREVVLGEVHFAGCHRWANLGENFHGHVVEVRCWMTVISIPTPEPAKFVDTQPHLYLIPAWIHQTGHIVEGPQVGRIAVVHEIVVHERLVSKRLDPMASRAVGVGRTHAPGGEYADRVGPQLLVPVEIVTQGDAVARGVRPGHHRRFDNIVEVGIRSGQTAGRIDNIAARAVAPVDARGAARAHHNLAIVDKGHTLSVVGVAVVQFFQRRPKVCEIAHTVGKRDDPITKSAVLKIREADHVGLAGLSGGHTDVVDLRRACRGPQTIFV